MKGQCFALIGVIDECLCLRNKSENEKDETDGIGMNFVPPKCTHIYRMIHARWTSIGPTKRIVQQEDHTALRGVARRRPLISLK